jgi:hypothetical protein
MISAVTPLNGSERAYAQYAFQHLHAAGRTLNVGCNDDSSNLRGRGVVNLDLFTLDPVTARPCPVDLIADARHLPFADNSWDTVILGDILEHCDDQVAAEIFTEARRVGRRIVITWPEDYRGIILQREGRTDIPSYTKDGQVEGYHKTPWTLARMKSITGEPAVYSQWDSVFGAECYHGMVIEP